jgi:very-short-patch-repair endonuclease
LAAGEFLRERGYRIARFVNDEVYRNMEGVLETILAALEGRSTL